MQSASEPSKTLITFISEESPTPMKNKIGTSPDPQDPKYTPPENYGHEAFSEYDS